MRRSFGAVLAVLGLGALGLSLTGSLRARQVPGFEEFRPAGPSNVLHVEAPPRSVAWTRTWLQLQAVVPLEYPDGIKLGDLVKRAREATRAPEHGFPRGVPIYVDRQGLADADKTLDSIVTVDLDGIALGKALTIALQQLTLVMHIGDDGLITITSDGCNDGAPISAEEANWQSLDRLNEEVATLRAEISALRQMLRPGAAPLPAPKPAPEFPAPPPSRRFN